MKGKLDVSEIYHQSEVEDFAAIFYQPDIAVNTECRANFIRASLRRSTVSNICRPMKPKTNSRDKSWHSSAFIPYPSQIIPFQDVELEKLYSFGRLLSPKLPQTDYADQLKLDNDYRPRILPNAEARRRRASLKADGDEAGIIREKDEKAKLSDIINILNNRFGTDFNEADNLFSTSSKKKCFRMKI